MADEENDYPHELQDDSPHERQDDSPHEQREDSPHEQRNDSPHEQQEGQKAKKRRLHGACDTCRKRKIKCNSAVRPENICSNCETSSIQCTHDIPRQPKKKETQQAYIQSLEERLSRMKYVFQALHPDRDIEMLLDLPVDGVSETPSVSIPVNKEALSKGFPELKYPTPHLPPAIFTNKSVAQEPKVDPVEEEQDLCHVELAEHLNKLFIEDKRFYGRASTYMFAHYTMLAKMEASGISTAYPLDSKMLRRPLYWDMRPWELSFARSQERSFVYPEPDLLDSLVALYFEKSNIIVPVLHRPTFLYSLNSGLHRRDSGFGMTVLLVCSIASRFTSDSRVLLDDDISGLSCGWKYYAQVPSLRNRLFEKCTLYDLQCYVLSVIYLMGTSTTHVVWPLIGLGIRFAQEKGLHRRNGKRKHTVQDEAAKRVFWSLIFLDRWLSAFHGRPCAMQDEEFDLDYPVECDDEYWETSDPERAFKQPTGKPCKITCFVWMIKLVEMLAFALRTLYSTKKSKMLIGLIGNEWESKVVAELDSSMNKWKDGLPHFLRWNSENPDTTFFCQSVALYTSFYHLQIQIHRPFLMKRSALSLTSLAMCTSAARSTAHVLEAAMSRGAALFPSTHVAAFAAALVLLHAHWAHQQSELIFDSKTTMELVRKIFLTLKDGERKWHCAGRFVDLMQTLGCLNDHRSNPQLKRRRELDIIDPPISQSRPNSRCALWEQVSSVGGSQRQIAPAKLEPPALMQSSSLPTNWGVNNFPSPRMNIQRSHVQPQPFITSQVDNTLSHPTLAGTNFRPHPSLSSQGAHLPHILDLQEHSSTEDPSSIGPNLSDDLFTMWSNLPISFSPYDSSWDAYLSDATQPQAQSRS